MRCAQHWALGPGCPSPPSTGTNSWLSKLEILARIERHVLWRKERLGIEISNVYTTLSGHIHSYQLGTEAVVFWKEMLTPEHCMLMAALMHDNVTVQLDPPVLRDKYNEVEARIPAT